MAEESTENRMTEDGTSGRVVALDYGRARIGVAASDPTGFLATPHSVIANAAPHASPPDALVELILQLRPREIVIGIPLNMDGSRGEMAREAAMFGRAVGDVTGLPIVEWDERLSTVRAARTLRDAGHRRRTQRDAGRTDAVAAAHTLQGYLDRSDE